MPVENSMEKKIIFWVVSLSFVAVALAILLPGGRPADSHPRLPWDIQLSTQGEVEVFGLTLGRSTLAEARDDFQMEGKVSLFITESGKPALEAYFEQVFLSGLRADFILVLDANDETLQRLYDHGSRISRTTDTTRKVVLGSDDLSQVSNLPIKLINYIPYANLDESLVINRFGPPAEKITESETGVSHWIYPERGFSIGLNPEGKELIQYMPLSQIKPLIERIEESNHAFEAAHKE
jgi:hypothetical protein